RSLPARRSPRPRRRAMQRTVTAKASGRVPPAIRKAFSSAFGFESLAMACFALVRLACAGRLAKALQESKMLKKVPVTSSAAAALLVSPSFVGLSLAQPAQLEPIDSQRIISEVVVNGRLIEAGAGHEALANEVRLVPSWVNRSGALDPRPQHSW